MAAPVYILTINGTERKVKLGTLAFQGVVNGQNTFSCIVLSDPDAPYRPTLGHEVVLSEDGTDIFGGFIDRTEEQGDDGQTIPEFMTEIVCVSYDVIADRRFVTETFPAGTTLEGVLDVLEDYVTDYGASKNAGQVTGPALTEDLILAGERLRDVFNKLSELTGYLWAFAPDKTFSMFTVGADAAPFNIVDTDLPAKYVGDIRVVRSREKYVNRVIVKIGDNAVVEKTETFTGDGATSTYPLTYTMVYTPVVGRGYVTHNGIYETLGLINAHWLFDPATNSLIYTPAEDNVPANLPNSDTAVIVYDAQFPMTVTVEDSAAITANGLFEDVYSYPAVYDVPTAQLLAASLLSKGLSIKEEAEYQTYEIGVLPGMTQTIAHADRDLSGSYLITEVRAVNPSNTQELLRTIKAVGGSEFRGTYRDLIRAWLGGGASGGASVPPAVSSGGAPSPPNRSVQFNRGGAFGGKTGFEFYEDELSIVCGDLSSIDAANFDGCQAFGYDCHIGDT